ncbi:MAG: NAD(+) synthase [bacterium]
MFSTIKDLLKDKEGKMIKDLGKLAAMLINRALELGQGCKKVFVAVSGGIDSALVAAILCKAFGPENVIGLYRDIRSNPIHKQDAELLQSIFKFKLICVDANRMYDEFIRIVKEWFLKSGLSWAEEGTPEADELGFTNAYASLKSRLTTPMAGFISKAIDGGNGRIFGTGNGEEDGLLRYFDKFGDGAVDNNILNGLNKAEVRQLARFLGVPERIICKTPSADLEACGDKHNDEYQLTSWAKKLGFPNLTISYGASDGSEEGNVAWAWDQDLKFEVISGSKADMTSEELLSYFGYSEEELQIILFLREVEKMTRHKVGPIPGLGRKLLIEAGVIDEVSIGKKRIAIFGGSFNPPCIHHIQIAKKLTEYFDKVVIAPCGTRKDKPSANIVDIKHRMEMAKLAFSGLRRVEFDFYDLENNVYTPAYYLQQRYEKTYPNDEIWHAIGTDLIKGGKEQQSEIHRNWILGGVIWQTLNWVAIIRPGYEIS